MVDDQLFREVEEELRRERMQQFWSKYGTLIIGAICGAVLLVGAGIWWKNSQISARQANGDQFIEALQLSAAGDAKKAEALLKTLSSESGAGYEQLAGLYLAGLHSEAGRKEEATALYKKIAEDRSADKILSEYAELNLALLALEGASYDKTKEMLSAYTGKGEAWRGTALEAVALAALKDKKLDEASTHFRTIADDAGLPGSLKRRAQIMLDVIATRKASP